MSYSYKYWDFKSNTAKEALMVQEYERVKGWWDSFRNKGLNWKDLELLFDDRNCLTMDQVAGGAVLCVEKLQKQLDHERAAKAGVIAQVKRLALENKRLREG